jgi:hypothetical protein
MFYDAKKKEKIYEISITNSEIIGRMKSGLFQLSQGHIYYNNDVIKIRQDLINSDQNASFTESEIFDMYPDVFELEDGMRIRSNTPLDSSRYRRFVYIFQDSNYLRTKTILITPYLHERRIYLNRVKFNTQYFYTSVQTSKQMEELYVSLLKSNTIKKLPLRK